MGKFLIVTIFLFAPALSKINFPRQAGPLFLTPLIEAGEVELAKQLAVVRLKSEGLLLEEETEERISFSGYFTVDDKHNSNLFFWFFPAVFPHPPFQSKVHPPPLMVWLEGGPGYPSIVDVFSNGPYRLHKNLTASSGREHDWTLGHSILYIDSPVGTGYSFTESKEGYAKNVDDVTRNLYSALVQFFRMFPEYQMDDVFIAGLSYAGKYIPALAHRIQYEKEFCEKQNPKDFDCKQTTINQKGIILLNPYLDPLSQLDYSQAHHQLGLIDQKTMMKQREFEKEWKAAIVRKDTAKTLELVKEFFQGPYVSQMGFQTLVAANRPSFPGDFVNPMKFFELPAVARALHARHTDFNRTTNSVLDELGSDFVESGLDHLDAILEANGTNVLLISSQLDPLIYPAGVEAFAGKLKYAQTRGFYDAQRTLWKSNGELRGYYKKVEALSLMTMLNAGHMVHYDQPRVTLDVVSQFINYLSV